MQSQSGNDARKKLWKLQTLMGAVRSVQAKPRMETADFGAMDEDELREVLTKGRVIWRRPGT